MQVLALQQLDEWLVQGVKQSKLGKISNYGKIEAFLPKGKFKRTICKRRRQKIRHH